MLCRSQSYTKRVKIQNIKSKSKMDFLNLDHSKMKGIRFDALHYNRGHATLNPENLGFIQMQKWLKEMEM